MFKKAAKQNPSTLGYGFALTSVLHWFCPYRLELMVYLLASWDGPGLNGSLHWDLSPLRIVPYGTDAFHQVACGDIEALKMTFGERASSVYDVTPNGCTLLHVRSNSRSDKARLLSDDTVSTLHRTDSTKWLSTLSRAARMLMQSMILASEYSTSIDPLPLDL